MLYFYTNLKCSLDPKQLEDRFRYEPDTIELQLFENDMSEPNRIVKTIQLLKKHGIKVFLHHPMKVKGKFLDILSEDLEVSTFYRYSCEVLNEICQNEDIYCVVHPHYERCESGKVDTTNLEGMVGLSDKMRKSIQELRLTTYDRFLWENAPSGIFSSANPYWLTHIVKPINLPVCYDISHSFMSFRGDNHKLEEDLREAFPFTKHYHVVDSAGTNVHDALSLGKGGINWSNLKSYILKRDFIFEIDLPNYEDCTAMIESRDYFNLIK